MSPFYMWAHKDQEKQMNLLREKLSSPESQASVLSAGSPNSRAIRIKQVRRKEEWSYSPVALGISPGNRSWVVLGEGNKGTEACWWVSLPRTNLDKLPTMAQRSIWHPGKMWALLSSSWSGNWVGLIPPVTWIPDLQPKLLTSRIVACILSSSPRNVPNSRPPDWWCLPLRWDHPGFLGKSLCLDLPTGWMCPWAASTPVLWCSTFWLSPSSRELNQHSTLQGSWGCLLV